MFCLRKVCEHEASSQVRERGTGEAFRGSLARMKCPHCPNASVYGWDDVSDMHTGTMYARCKGCGRHTLTSSGGYVDWNIGLMLDSGAALGSAWTQQVSAEVLPEVSRLTTKPRRR